MLASFMSPMTQTSVIGKEVVSNEKMPPEDPAVDKPAGHFFNW